MVFGVLWLGRHQIEDSLLGLGGIGWVVTYVVGGVFQALLHGDVSSDKLSGELLSGSANLTSLVLVSATAERNAVLHERPLLLNIDFFANMTVVPMWIDICYRIMAHKLPERTKRVLAGVSLHRQWESIRPKLEIRFLLAYLQLNCWLLRLLNSSRYH